jgi:hypothetical protein
LFIAKDGGEMILMEDTLFLVLYWTGPVGLGIFFAGLGYLIKCVAKAAQKEKQPKDTKG